MAIEVATYVPFPRQQQFHSSPAKYRLFGGAAGPGKTTALLWDAIKKCMVVPGSNSLLLRRTFPELDMNILNEWRANVPFRQMGVKYNESQHLATFTNNATLRFGYCQSENDVYQYQGAEFLFIGIDELTMFTLKQWLFLMTRNRCRIVGSFPCMAGATNPGNIGHAWVKSLWIDKKPPIGMRPQDYLADEYEFIPAQIEDNPIYANDRDYLAKLEASPMRDALRRGDWGIATDIYFDNFSYEAHTIGDDWLEQWFEKMADLRVKLRWWISYDWGDYHPNSMYLHAMDNTGQIVTVAEEWVPHTSEHSERTMAHKAVSMSDQFNCRPESFIMSWDAFGKLSKHTKQPITKLVIDGLPEDFPRPFPSDASPGSRISRARFMKRCLTDGRWKISRSCVKLIECLPNLIRDMERNPEDVLKVDWSETSLGDDPYDAASYGLQYVSNYAPQIPPKPAPSESGKYEAFKLKEKIEGMDKKNDPAVVTSISNLPKRRRSFH